MRTLDRALARTVLVAFAKARQAKVPKTVGEQARSVASVAHLLEYNGAVLLYGDAGVGKTVEALLVAFWLAAQQNRPCLVLAPKGEVRDKRWLVDAQALRTALERVSAQHPADRTLRRLTKTEVEPLDRFNTQTGQKLAGRAVVALATKPGFSKLATQPGVRQQRRNFIARAGFALVVLDEAHRAAGAHTLTGSLLRELLAPPPPKKWSVPLLSLTATPIRQRSDDLVELIGANLNTDGREELARIEHYHRAAHHLVRRSWNPSLGELTPAQRQNVRRLKSEAKKVLDKHVVREQPGRKSDPPVRHDVPAGEAWGRGYGLARILPAVLKEQECGDEPAKSVRPSDAYRRMLLSSSAAFWASPPGKALKALKDSQTEAGPELAKVLEALLGPPGHSPKPEGLLRHPKVAWTVERALAEAQNRQVLVFVEYLSTQSALVDALRSQAPDAIKIGTPADHNFPETFQKHNHGMVMVASPKHQEAIEFDLEEAAGTEPDRMVIHHDLPWSAVALRQRHGRLQRVRRNFPDIIAEAPLLCLPDDQRLWRTVSGRWDVSGYVDATFTLPKGTTALSEGVPSPNTLDPGVGRDARLG